MIQDADERWQISAAGVERAIRAYFREQGRDPDSPNIRATVATNTELVPRRAENLRRALDGLTDLESPRGLDLVEVGCGFGALAAYIAISWEPRSVRALDIRPEFAASAQDLARELRLEGLLTVCRDDMRTLASVPTASADLVVANNAFIYLGTAADMARALDAFVRVLRPGGHVLFFHANKHLRDPFTHDPVIHLLPRFLARPVAKVTGWRDSRDRVRLLWPWQLRRLLLATGFDEFRAGAFRRGSFDVSRRGRQARFYAAAARRPATSSASSSSS